MIGITISAENQPWGAGAVGSATFSVADTTCLPQIWVFAGHQSSVFDKFFLGSVMRK